MTMINILILEWFNICEQFIKNNQTKHKWDEQKCLLLFWKGIISTKYLNSTLIEKCIEILPKLNNVNMSSVCSTISFNPDLTMEIFSCWCEYEYQCYFRSS